MSNQGSPSVQFSHSVVSDSLWSHGLQHARPPCPSLTPGVYSNSRLLSQWCHPTISSSVTPFSSCLQSFPASGSFPMSQVFASGGQSIGASASASVLPMTIQDWFPLGLTGLITLLSKGLSRVFSSTTVWKHQLFSAQPSLWSNSVLFTDMAGDIPFLRCKLRNSQVEEMHRAGKAWEKGTKLPCSLQVPLSPALHSPTWGRFTNLEAP